MSAQVRKTKTPKHSQKYASEPEPESETESNLMNIVKFKNLKLGQEYIVYNYTEPITSITSKYGDYRILEISEVESEETFEIFSTPLLMKYIADEESTNNFKFIVKHSRGNQYPFIEGYRQERKWVKSK